MTNFFEEMFLFFVFFITFGSSYLRYFDIFMANMNCRGKSFSNQHTCAGKCDKDITMSNISSLKWSPVGRQTPGYSIYKVDPPGL